jgi:hypothetical protein
MRKKTLKVCKSSFSCHLLGWLSPFPPNCFLSLSLCARPHGSTSAASLRVWLHCRVSPWITRKPTQSLRSVPRAVRTQHRPTSTRRSRFYNWSFSYGSPHLTDPIRRRVWMAARSDTRGCGDQPWSCPWLSRSSVRCTAHVHSASTTCWCAERAHE